MSDLIHVLVPIFCVLHQSKWEVGMRVTISKTLRARKVATIVRGGLVQGMVETMVNKKMPN